MLYEVLKSIVMLDYPRDKLRIYVVSYIEDEEDRKYVESINNEYGTNIVYLQVESPNISVKVNYGLHVCINNDNNSSIILVTPDDVVIDPTTLRDALNYLKDPRVGVVTFPAVGECSSLTEKLHQCKYIGITSTANTIMVVNVFKREVFERAGLYREDMGPPYTIHEDWELGSRIRRSGYKVIVDGKLVMKDLGGKTLRKAKDNDKRIKKKHNPLNNMINYAKSYIGKNWWSMLQVFKSSPLEQLLEYAFYFMNPIIFIVLTIINWVWSLAYLGLILLVIVLHSFVKGYYRIFPIRYRIIYPLVLVGVRTYRMYLFVIAFMMNAIHLCFNILIKLIIPGRCYE